MYVNGQVREDIYELTDDRSVSKADESGAGWIMIQVGRSGLRQWRVTPVVVCEATHV
jgi:hypothetical protein